MLTSEQINDIRSSVNIVDIVSSYIPLTKRGKNYFGVCPFHPDGDPSFCVSEQKQIYTCFSCKSTGNAIHFVMNYENISFLEAIKVIAKKANIHIDVGNITSSSNEKNENLYEIYDLASKFYQNNINTANGTKAKQYLYDRGFSDEIIKEFMIGLSLTNHDLLTKILLNKKKNYDDMLKSGLVVKNNYGYSDIYSNRIMFPIWDITGKVVGFSGRVFNGEDTSKFAKYINTKETPIFKKGELLYNYHRAKNSCRIKNSVIIVEGQLDLIRIYSVGISNVVATMGTAFTKDHAMLIKRLARDVVICFDGDSAGEKATVACGDELSNIGMSPKIVRLEDNLDPDEYIKKFGGQKFIDKIENPMNFMDFKLSFYKNGKNFNDNNDIAKYVNTIIDELSKIDDDVLKELTLKKISLESNLDIDFLKEKLNNRKIPTEKKENHKESINKENKYEMATKHLIYYMLRSKEVIKMYNNSKVFIPLEKYRLLAKEIYGFYVNNGYISVADLMNSFNDDKEFINLIGEIELLNLSDTYNVSQIEDYINVLKQYSINSEINVLEKKLRSTFDRKEKLKLAEKLLELKKEQNEVMEEK